MQGNFTIINIRLNFLNIQLGFLPSDSRFPDLSRQAPSSSSACSPRRNTTETLKNISFLLIRDWQKLQVATDVLPAAYRNDPKVGVVKPFHVEALETAREAVQASLSFFSCVNDAIFFLNERRVKQFQY